MKYSFFVFENLFTLFIIMFLSSCTSSNLKDGINNSQNIYNDKSKILSTSTISENSKFAFVPNDDSLIKSSNLPPIIEFQKIIGPPQSVVNRLNRAIRKSAKNNAIRLASYGQRDATYKIKGFFSALDDGAGSTLIYVWEISNGSGKMIHRISGEEHSASRNIDPWIAINSEMVDSIIKHGMIDLKLWIDTYN